MQKNESGYTRDLIKAFNEYEGVFVWKNHGGMYGANGISDIIGIYKGSFIAIEVKRIKIGSAEMVVNKCTALQKQFLEKISEKHGIAGILGIDPVHKKFVLMKPCANNSYSYLDALYSKISDIVKIIIAENVL